MILSALKQISILFIGALFFWGCSTGANGMYDTFFVGEHGMQYFIHPIEFAGLQETSGSAQLDFTCRYKNAETDSSIVNISLIGQTGTRSLDSIVIMNSTIKFALKNPEVMFVEREKSNVVSRFTAKTQTALIKNLFAQTDWRIEVYSSQNILRYTAGSKAKSIIEDVNYAIFSLF
ncbi:MAG: hypothetical protein LWX56_00430 [Ignavibacteria bacterium]|nr:hypothetical protein [Ignavibacteria bacterium]